MQSERYREKGHSARCKKCVAEDLIYFVSFEDVVLRQSIGSDLYISDSTFAIHPHKGSG